MKGNPFPHPGDPSEYFPEREHKLFVYGTMLRGNRNHARLNGARMLRLATTKPKYEMFTRWCRRGYDAPVVVPGGFSIDGELYVVPGSTLKVIDFAEGHPNVYQRQAIQLLGDRDPVWIYLYVGPRGGLSKTNVFTQEGTQSFLEMSWR